MADEKKAESKSAKKADQPEVVWGEEGYERGFIGEVPQKEYDNEEYALTSGAASPPYPLGQ